MSLFYISYHTSILALTEEVPPLSARSVVKFIDRIPDEKNIHRVRYGYLPQASVVSSLMHSVIPRSSSHSFSVIPPPSTLPPGSSPPQFQSQEVTSGMPVMEVAMPAKLPEASKTSAGFSKFHPSKAGSFDGTRDKPSRPDPIPLQVKRSPTKHTKEIILCERYEADEDHEEISRRRLLPGKHGKAKIVSDEGQALQALQSAMLSYEGFGTSNAPTPSVSGADEFNPPVFSCSAILDEAPMVSSSRDREKGMAAKKAKKKRHSLSSPMTADASKPTMPPVSWRVQDMVEPCFNLAEKASVQKRERPCMDRIPSGYHYDRFVLTSASRFHRPVRFAGLTLWKELIVFVLTELEFAS